MVQAFEVKTKAEMQQRRQTHTRLTSEFAEATSTT